MDDDKKYPANSNVLDESKDVKPEFDNDSDDSNEGRDGEKKTDFPYPKYRKSSYNTKGHSAAQHVVESVLTGVSDAINSPVEDHETRRPRLRDSSILKIGAVMVALRIVDVTGRVLVAKAIGSRRK